MPAATRYYSPVNERPLPGAKARLYVGHVVCHVVCHAELCGGQGQGQGQGCRGGGVSKRWDRRGRRGWRGGGGCNGWGEVRARGVRLARHRQVDRGPRGPGLQPVHQEVRARSTCCTRQPRDTSPMIMGLCRDCTSCTTHHAPRTTHHAPRTTHHAPRTRRGAHPTHPRTTHHAPCTRGAGDPPSYVSRAARAGTRWWTTWTFVRRGC